MLEGAGISSHVQNFCQTMPELVVSEAKGLITRAGRGRFWYITLRAGEFIAGIEHFRGWKWPCEDAGSYPVQRDALQEKHPAIEALTVSCPQSGNPAPAEIVFFWIGVSIHCTGAGRLSAF